MAIPLKQIEGKYEILEKISEGGMGAVYKVRHRLLEEIRVIKVMRPQLSGEKGFRDRFLREARLATKLRHPAIAQLYDFAMDDEGNAFMVIEYIPGITLQQMLERTGAPSPGLALAVARQTLEALGYLHRKGIVHRDISPDNIMVTGDEEGLPIAKLIDLGIAKVLGAEGGGLTATGMFIGKVRYSSPEHFRAQEGATLDARSDLYSMGVVLYELLTGQHPIAGSTVSNLIAGHLFHAPTPFETSDPEGRVPPDLRKIVLKSLAKDPDDRWPGAREMAHALKVVEERFPSPKEELAAVLAPRDTTVTQMPHKPGSTQERLNERFVPSTTPLPETPPPAAIDGLGVTTPMTDEGAAALAASKRADALADHVAELMSAGDLEAARERLAGGRQLAPDHSGLRRLEAEVEERARAEAAGRAAAKIRQCLEAGDLGGAAEQLERLSPQLVDHPELAGVRSELEARRRDEEVAGISELLEAQRLTLAEEALIAAEARQGRTDELVGLRQRLDEARRNAEQMEAPPSDQTLRFAVPVAAPRPATDAPAATGRPPAERTAADAPAVRPAPTPPVRPPVPPRPQPPPERPIPETRPAPPSRPKARPVPPATSAARQARGGIRRWLWPAVIVVVVAVAAVAGWRFLRPVPPPVATGTLVVDAVPWGEVMSVTATDGTAVPLPEATATPLVMTVAAGSYRVKVRNPASQAEATLDADVESGGTTRRVARLDPPSADEFLQRLGVSREP